MKQILNVIGVGNVIIYLVIINILGFLVMGLDKWKAKRGSWRIPENTLLMFTILGGGIGTILGMYTFRHKTKKPKFTIGMPVILVLEILFVVYLFFVTNGDKPKEEIDNSNNSVVEYQENSNM